MEQQEVMLVASIDPGVTGAVAFVDDLSHSVPHVENLPTLTIGKRVTINPYALAQILNVHQPGHIVIENVATRPGQGISSSGNFMYGAGVLFGVAGALGIDVSFVTPQQWKRALNLIGTSKEASRKLANRLFPELEQQLKRKKDADRAEALLISHWYIITRGGYDLASRPRLKPLASAAPSRSRRSLCRSSSRRRTPALDAHHSGSRKRLTA